METGRSRMQHGSFRETTVLVCGFADADRDALVSRVQEMGGNTQTRLHSTTLPHVVVCGKMLDEHYRVCFACSCAAVQQCLRPQPDCVECIQRARRQCTAKPHKLARHAFQVSPMPYANMRHAVVAVPVAAGPLYALACRRIRTQAAACQCVLNPSSSMQHACAACMYHACDVKAPACTPCRLSCV